MAEVSDIKRLPPTHPLYSAWIKLERANLHVSALHRSIKRHLRVKKNVVTTRELDIQGIGKIYHVNPVTPVRWGLIAGDALTNLRASLDHITWALKVDTPKSPRQIQFPIFSDQEKYSKTRGGAGRMLADVRVDAHNLVERFQPYHISDWPETDLLRLLNELVNADKHQVLTQTVVQMSVGPLAIFDPLGNDPSKSTTFRSPYDFIVTKRVLEGMKQRNLKPQISVQVTFSAEGASFDGTDVRCLNLIHDFIRDEVIPSFTGLFE